MVEVIELWGSVYGNGEKITSEMKEYGESPVQSHGSVSTIVVQ